MRDGGFTKRSDHALQTTEQITYDRWHELMLRPPCRFYGLRRYEAGMLSSHPNALPADGTEWRFLDTIRRELKG